MEYTLIRNGIILLIISLKEELWMNIVPVLFWYFRNYLLTVIIAQYTRIFPSWRQWRSFIANGNAPDSLSLVASVAFASQPSDAAKNSCVVDFQPPQNSTPAHTLIIRHSYITIYFTTLSSQHSGRSHEQATRKHTCCRPLSRLQGRIWWGVIQPI